MTTTHITRPVRYVFALLATALLMLSFSACGSGSAQGDSAPTTTVRHTATTRPTTTTTERSTRTTTSDTAARTTRVPTTVPATTETPVTTAAPTTTVPATTVPPPTSVTVPSTAATSSSNNQSEASEYISILEDDQWPGSSELVITWGCVAVKDGAGEQVLSHEDSSWEDNAGNLIPGWETAANEIGINPYFDPLTATETGEVILQLPDDTSYQGAEQYAAMINEILENGDPCGVKEYVPPSESTNPDDSCNGAANIPDIPGANWEDYGFKGCDAQDVFYVQDHPGQTYCMLIAQKGPLAQAEFPPPVQEQEINPGSNNPYRWVFPFDNEQGFVPVEDAGMTPYNHGDLEGQYSLTVRTFVGECPLNN